MEHFFADEPEQKTRAKLLPKSLEEYFSARLDERAQELDPVYGKITYAPATEIAEARRQIACLDMQLVKARSQWNEDKKGLNERWQISKERYDALYESFPRLNGYFKDSFAKRERSDIAKAHEIEQIHDKDKEIRRLQKETEKLYEVRDDTHYRLERFSVFEDYLKKVKESSQGEYQEVRELIDRFNILADAREALSTKNEKTRDTIQMRQKRMQTDVLTKSNEVLTYRNYLSELLQYHDQLQDQVRILDDSLLRIKTTAAHRTLIIGQIKMAIQNLYFQVCKHMHRAAKLAPNDTLGQLSDIKISIVEMIKLSKDIKHMLKAAFMAAEAEKNAKEKANRRSEEKRKRIERLVNSGHDEHDMREVFGFTPKMIPISDKFNKPQTKQNKQDDEYEYE